MIFFYGFLGSGFFVPTLAPYRSRKKSYKLYNLHAFTFRLSYRLCPMPSAWTGTRPPDLRSTFPTVPSSVPGNFFSPLKHGPPPSIYFCLLLKFIIRHSYLKILDLANPFVADAPMKKKSRNLVLPPSQSTLKYGSENRPWPRG